MRTLEEFEISLFKDIAIDDSSPYALSEELKTHSRKSAEYQRLYAHAVKKVLDLKLQLEILSAVIVNDLREKAEEKKGGQLSDIAVTNIRKNLLPLDERYQKLKEDLNTAKGTSDVLKGFVFAFSSRGGKLKEIAGIMDKMMQSNPRLFDKRGPQLKTKEREAGKLLDYGEEE